MTTPLPLGSLMVGSKTVLSIAVLCGGLAAMAAPSFAQPADGTYSGTTDQGKSISVVVSGGKVSSWSVGYQCSGFSAAAVVLPGSCSIVNNSFSCGSTSCIPFAATTRLSGTFNGVGVAGNLSVSHKPDVFASCCQLNNRSWSATLVGGGSPPNAAFLWSPASPPVGQLVLFSDTSTGKPTAWAWDFGDGSTSNQKNPMHTFDLPGTYSVELEVSNAFGDDTVSHDVTVTGTTSTCVPGPTVLCLSDGRFKVEVFWRDFQNNTGMGQVVPFGSDDSGLLWFFSPDNWEMLVKILNACSFADHFWVFSAATTNVEYTLRVTDTETGAVKEYFNPLRTAAPALTDTEAFATCP